MDLVILEAVTFADSAQAYELAKRIYDAYVRRCEAVGYTPTASYEPVDASTKIFDFISNMQSAIESLADYAWWDPNEDLEVFDSVLDVDGFVKLSADELLTASGLTGETSGAKYWRRIPNYSGPPSDLTYANEAFSYGPIQDKDLAGPWLFEDLQTALKFMRRSKTSVYYSEGEEASTLVELGDEGTETCQEVYDFVPSVWENTAAFGPVSGDAESYGGGVKGSCEQYLYSKYTETYRIGGYEDSYSKSYTLFRLQVSNTVPSDPDDSVLFTVFSSSAAVGGLDVDGVDFPYYKGMTTGITSHYDPATLSGATPDPWTYPNPPPFEEQDGTYQISDTVLSEVFVDFVFGDEPS